MWKTSLYKVVKEGKAPHCYVIFKQIWRKQGAGLLLSDESKFKQSSFRVLTQHKIK